MPPVPQVDLNPHTPFLLSVLFKWKHWGSFLRFILYLCSGPLIFASLGTAPVSPLSLLTTSMRLNTCKSFLSLRNILSQVHYFPPATTVSLLSHLKLSFLDKSSRLAHFQVTALLPSSILRLDIPSSPVCWCSERLRCQSSSPLSACKMPSPGQMCP